MGHCCNCMQQMQHHCNLCDIAAISATLQQCCICCMQSLQQLQHCRDPMWHATNATLRCPPLLLLLLLSSPKDYHAFDVITWMSCVVTMTATMTRMIASIIEGWQQWRVVAIATPEVVVTRPAAVTTFFLCTARFKTGNDGGTHIQPPPQGNRTRRPSLDQALKLKGNTLLCGLEYGTIV
jgi:hypothetical protein